MFVIVGLPKMIAKEMSKSFLKDLKPGYLFVIFRTVSYAYKTVGDRCNLQSDAEVLSNLKIHTGNTQRIGSQ